MATDRMAHNPSAPIVRSMIPVPDHHSTEPNGVGFYERLGYHDDDVTVLSRWLSEPS